MKILMLVNQAHCIRPFYKSVASVLEGRGHEVHFALDSHLTDFTYPDAALGSRTYYFSDYHRVNASRRTLPKQLEGLNTSLMMFPDVERMQHTNAQPKRDANWLHSLAANLAHFFWDLFGAQQFDACVYENVSNAFSYFAWEVAQRKGALFIGFVPSRLPGRTDVLDCALARDSRFPVVYEALRSGKRGLDTEASAWVDEYLTNFEQKKPDYMTNHPIEASVVDRYLNKSALLRFTRAMRYQLTSKADADFAYQVHNPFFAYPAQFLTEAIRQKLKAPLLLRSYYAHEVDLAVPYFVYPIQFHPESATSVDGPNFIDEWSNIEVLSLNMPHGYSLYVKDHKHAIARPSLDFYRRVMKLPNVKLVSPHYDNKKLMRHSKAIVCSTSTMGFEALVIGRPVYLLGRPFYDFFPGAVRLNGFEGAHDLFVNHESVKATPHEVRCLVGAYYLTSEPGTFDLLTMFENPDLIERFASIVERRATEHPRAVSLRDDTRRSVFVQSS